MMRNRLSVAVVGLTFSLFFQPFLALPSLAGDEDVPQASEAPPIEGTSELDDLMNTPAGEALPNPSIGGKKVANKAAPAKKAQRATEDDLFLPDTEAAPQAPSNAGPNLGTNEFAPAPAYSGDELEAPPATEEIVEYVDVEEDAPPAPAPYLEPVATGDEATLAHETRPPENPKRPAVTLFGGVASKNYSITPYYYDGTFKSGYEFGTTLRIWNISDVVALHGTFIAGLFSFSNLDQAAQVRDVNFRVGPTFEFNLSRSFNIYAGLLYYSNNVRAQSPLDVQNSNRPVINEAGLNTRLDALESISDENEIRFGGGAQWDFLVQPHYSLGARIFAEWNHNRSEISYASLSLAFAFEAAPRRRLSLNFDTID